MFAGLFGSDQPARQTLQRISTLASRTFSSNPVSSASAMLLSIVAMRSIIPYFGGKCKS